ncbi:hypothetical protein ACA910_014393 [Epithemia clementina (nom. ined.)]
MPTSLQEDSLVAAVNAVLRNWHHHEAVRNETSIFVPTADANVTLNFALLASIEATSTNLFLKALTLVEIPSWLLTDTGIPVVLVLSNGNTQYGKTLQLSISKDKFTVKLQVPAFAAAVMSSNGTTTVGGYVHSTG